MADDAQPPLCIPTGNQLPNRPDRVENEVLQIELRRLGHLIEENADSLRNAFRRGKFTLGDFRFRFIKRDKNTVYHVTGKYAWYLKLPTSIRARMMQRESLGTRLASENLSCVEGYHTARATRVSLTYGYVLVAEVAGRPLNRFLYLSAFRFPGFGPSGLRRVYANLGRALGRLHSLSVQDRVIESDRGVHKTASRWDTETCLDKPLRDAMEMALQKVPDEMHRCLVHGNPRMDNILVNKQRVSLIDFENTGTGSPYDDLSIVCSQLEILQTLVWFPVIVPRAALNAFLTAYHLEHALEVAILERCVAIRLVEFYREYVRKGGGSMAGIPIVRRKLHSLIIESLA